MLISFTLYRVFYLLLIVCNFSLHIKRFRVTVYSLHIGLVISAALQQMIEGGGQLGRVRLILGIEPAEGKTDRQPRHQTMLRQWGDHLTGRFVNEVQAGAGRAHRAMIMPGHVGAEWQVS